MTPQSYPELLGALLPRLGGGIRWGLERTERLLAAVGDPHRRYWTLHVGGTNGKGSVAALLASVLRAAGVRTGLYTSPHLCSFRERIQVDGAPLPAEALVAAAARLWPAIEAEGPSFFEATTALAFLALAEADVEAAVVEVGLGGRLDATNVIEPAVAVITNVALDHAQYLGDTLASVAREKAGIIKRGVPAVTAEADPAVRAIFRDRAEAVGAPLVVLDREALRDVRVGLDGTSFRLATRAWGELALATPLVGPHQAVNAGLAVRALEALPAGHRPPAEAVVRGLRAVVWPGRFQVERIGGATWVFDVAHNPAGVAALVRTIEAVPLPRPLTALVGVLGDKDWSGMLPPLRHAADRMILTVPESAPPHRRWDPAAVLARLPGLDAEVVEPFERALARAAEAGGGTVLVTGSFHTVGDALAALGRAPFGVDPALPAPAAAP